MHATLPDALTPAGPGASLGCSTPASGGVHFFVDVAGVPDAKLGPTHAYPELCAGAPRIVANVWNPDVRQRVRQSLTSVGKPLAIPAAAATDAFIDRSL